jgi:hypothetical protein
MNICIAFQFYISRECYRYSTALVLTCAYSYGHFKPCVKLLCQYLTKWYIFLHPYPHINNVDISDENWHLFGANQQESCCMFVLIQQTQHVYTRPTMNTCEHELTQWRYYMWFDDVISHVPLFTYLWTGMYFLAKIEEHKAIWVSNWSSLYLGYD